MRQVNSNKLPTTIELKLHEYLILKLVGCSSELPEHILQSQDSHLSPPSEHLSRWSFLRSTAYCTVLTRLSDSELSELENDGESFERKALQRAWQLQEVLPTVLHCAALHL